MLADQSVIFLWNTLVFPFIEVVKMGVKKCCKRNARISRESFFASCKNGDLNAVIYLLDNESDLDLDQGLLYAIEAKNKEIVEYLLNNGATCVNDGLRMACVNNSMEIAELCVKKGANIVVGLRVAKSPNIIKMLYRYESNGEVIN